MADNNVAEEKAKTSFYFRKDLQKKLKYIALRDNRNLTDVLEEAASEYITNYEKKNGEIKI